MHHGQKQHRSVYMKIVKYDIFELVKDTLGFEQLCTVMDVTFAQQQCDCLYREIIIFNGICHVQTGERCIIVNFTCGLPINS